MPAVTATQGASEGRKEGREERRKPSLWLLFAIAQVEVHGAFPLGYTCLSGARS